MKKNIEVTRRNFLRLSLTAAAGSALAACAPSTPAAPAAPTATTAPAAAEPPAVAPAVAKGEMRVIPTTVKLPTDKVTFRFIDSGDTKAVFWKKYFELYQKAYPNITVQYDGLPWNEINKIVPLGIQNGNAHDTFSLPQTVTAAQAVAEGWLRPLDDLIPNLEELKATFPGGSFVEGINVFDGKTYCLPHSTSKRSSTMLLYNQKYMEAAGFDPTSKVMSWDDYRAAAKKITENGKGAYYGVIIGGNQLNRWGDVVGSLARFSGATVGPDYINFKTGRYEYTSDAIIAAMELLLALRDDGSFFPGYLSINAPQARAQIAQGAAGMILQGLWCLPQWKVENPDFMYGAAHTPVADPANIGVNYANPGGNNEMWVYAKSAHPEIAADLFYYRSTLEGQYAWNKIAGVSDPGIFPEAMETASDDPRDLKALEIQNKMYRIAPSPLVRNPEVAKVSLELKPITPNFNEVIQGLMSGQLTDVKASFQDVQDRAEAELDRAISAAQDKGAKVSRDDYTFANWDPTADYLEADYNA